MGIEQVGDILIERFDVIACSKCNQPIDTSQSLPFTQIHCPACAVSMRVPARFANFILLDQLGKGGMGAVYKAYDETLGRTIALKVMQQSIGKDRAFVEQFLQEARALAAINNPHIVQIYSYAAGMTHGDIKPANILYDKANSAKVADFGLARFKGEKPKPGEVWGTPYYVAPEVVKGQAPNAGSDIYSLGGTLYHVLTGEPPFNCESVTDTVLLRFKEPAPDPRVYRNSIDPRTAAILLRMLEMDPFARYPTYESLLKDVTVVLESLRDARSGKKPVRKKSVVVPVVLGLVALALIAGGSYLGMAIFKARQAEKKKQAQIEADKAAGRLRQVMRNGQLVWVRIDAADAAAPGAAATPVNDWSIPATLDVAVAGDDSAADLKDQTILLLRGGNSGKLEDASKIYLRFPLANVDRRRVNEAALQLTAGRKGAVKTKTPHYQMKVWVLKSDLSGGWDDLTKWSTAPGNDIKDAGSMLANGASLVATFDLPPNPETGDRLLVDVKPLLDSLRDPAVEHVTLVLTGDTDTDHKGGWRITATEDADRFPPPTLLLKAK